MSEGVSVREALELLDCQGEELAELWARATRVRSRYRGRAVDPCAIINAKSGHCGENCAFCAQSARSRAVIEKYPLRTLESLWAEARSLAEAGARRVSLVTSGRVVRPGAELDLLAIVVQRMTMELEVDACASLGLLETGGLQALREAGLSRYHHNLETAESYFPQVCTSRSWRESVDTVEAAQSLGLEVCCGGIFGLGESLAQRVELLETIRQLDVACVPINFLHPIEGTPLAGHRELEPLDCLKLVAVARLMMPQKEVRLCGGREHNLRDLQSWVFLAGADGIMVGGYLTTAGRTMADDLRMVRDAGLELRPGRSRDQG